MNNNKRYNRYTWSDPRLYFQESNVDGTGIFTKEKIKEGEIVMVWGGLLVKRNDPDLKLNFRYHTLIQIDEENYLGAPIIDNKSLDEHLNHSCDPSVWLIDDVTLVARRDINIGEEITLDQGTWNDEEYGSAICGCGSKICRKILTKKDYSLPLLHSIYGNHFSPYLLAKLQIQ